MQRKSTAGSAKTTRPVIDALIDGLISERPQTRYLVDDGDSFIDMPSVGFVNLKQTHVLFMLNFDGQNNSVEIVTKYIKNVLKRSF